MGIRVFDMAPKAAYGRMARLTHPDKVPAELKESAKRAFQHLSRNWADFGKPKQQELAHFRSLPWRFEEEALLARLWCEHSGLPVPPATNGPPPAHNQEQKREKFTGEYEVRREYISRKSIMEFLSFTAARRARHPEKGSLAQVCVGGVQG